jgi:hypothetical protein
VHNVRPDRRPDDYAGKVRDTLLGILVLIRCMPSMSTDQTSTWNATLRRFSPYRLPRAEIILGVNAADARLWHPWLRINRVLRVMPWFTSRQSAILSPWSSA